MRSQRRFRPFLIALAIVSFACWCLPGGCSDEPPAPIPQNTPTDTIPPAPTSTFTPVPSPSPTPRERCWFFEQMAMRIIMFDLKPSDAIMTMYVEMPGGVPGLELLVEDDDQPWEYWVELGESESNSCSFEGYDERLYCFIPIPPEYHNTTQPFNLLVNLCGHPLLSHPALSVMVQTEFDDIPIDTCGPAPGDSCDVEYEEWCSCKGGIYECVIYGGTIPITQPVCILP